MNVWVPLIAAVCLGLFGGYIRIGPFAFAFNVAWIAGITLAMNREALRRTELELEDTPMRVGLLQGRAAILVGLSLISAAIQGAAYLIAFWVHR